MKWKSYSWPIIIGEAASKFGFFGALDVALFGYLPSLAGLFAAGEVSADVLAVLALLSNGQKVI